MGVLYGQMSSTPRLQDFPLLQFLFNTCFYSAFTELVISVYVVTVNFVFMYHCNSLLIWAVKDTAILQTHRVLGFSIREFLYSEANVDSTENRLVPSIFKYL